MMDTTSSAHQDVEAIAVVGMSGRFPGAPDIASFWRAICEGRECITQLNDADLAASGIAASEIGPDYVRARGVLADADCFDHAFFGINPREAALMDPQHRLLLETCAAALDNAGIDPTRLEGWAGVFAGAARASYWQRNLTDHPALAYEGDDQLFLGNEKDFLATRVAFKLDLHGPAMDIQTGCSTSLVAIHNACRSLLSFDCDVALAGGVTVALPLTGGYPYREGSVLARDGHCRPFDAAGDGIVPGNAVAVIVLKRLSEAIADGNFIHGVIRSSAINNDGARKISFTAPSIEGQSQVILLAQQVAGITADEIGLVEAHGTGTRLGDPIEVSALTQAFRATTQAQHYCALGSVKGNVGHLDAAAGVAGLIKAICAVRDAVLPPTININKPNPAIDFEKSPFFLPQTAQHWNSPRRLAGVSAFGIGGTNAHIIVENPPAHGSNPQSTQAMILPLSARTEQAREAMTDALADTLVKEAYALGDVAHTLQNGRRRFEYRRAIIASDRADAERSLRTRSGRIIDGVAFPSQPRVAFIFPGGGVHYAGMAKDLMHEPAFKAAISEMIAGFSAVGIDLGPLLRGDVHDAPASITLPAIFTVSYATAKLWQSRNIMPDVMLGHSLGELTAATIAGVFTPNDAARVVAMRARLQEEQAAGAMISVMASAEQVLMLSSDLIDIAAINGPELCAVAGPVPAIEALEQALDANDIRYFRLPLAVGGHSRATRALAQDFRAVLDSVRKYAPSKPIISSIDGKAANDRMATSDYWVQHLCEQVRFDRALDTLLSEPDWVLIECGPGDVGIGLASQYPRFTAQHCIIASIRKHNHEDDDRLFFKTALARAFITGLSPVLSHHVDEADGYSVPLPSYPFERTRLWIDPPTADQKRTPSHGPKPIVEWFAMPIWRRTASPLCSEEGGGSVLVFDDDSAAAEALITQLESKGYAPITRIRRGYAFDVIDETHFVVRPGHVEDLTTALIASAAEPNLVIHLWSRGTSLDEQADGFLTITSFMQAIAAVPVPPPSRIIVLCDQLYTVETADSVTPARATLLGATQIIPQEYPTTRCTVIDLAPTGTPDSLAHAAMTEIQALPSDPVIAWRNGRRFVQDYESIRLQGQPSEKRALRPGDLLVITGGLGRVGLLLASHFARDKGLRIALVTRPGFAPENQWDRNDIHYDDKTAARITALRNLKKAGADISVYEADVGDSAALTRTLLQIEANHGPVRAIIHAAAVTHGPSLISPIANLDQDYAKAQFRPKVDGVEALARAVSELQAPPALVLLLSSNASVLGGIGFAAYAAANHVLDCFAASRPREQATVWISSNWDRWLLSNDELAKGQGTSMDAFAMTPSESLEAITQIITLANVEQIVVTKGDLAARRAIWIAGQHQHNRSNDPVARPRSTKIPFRAPETDTQRLLCQLWSEMLGIETIGLDDNFFELGGHSLRAIQLLSRIAEIFHVRLSLKTFFAGPNIAALSTEIITALSRPESENTVASLLDGLEGLSGDIAPVVEAHS